MDDRVELWQPRGNDVNHFTGLNRGVDLSQPGKNHLCERLCGIWVRKLAVNLRGFAHMNHWVVLGARLHSIEWRFSSSFPKRTNPGFGSPSRNHLEPWRAAPQLQFEQDRLASPSPFGPVSVTRLQPRDGDEADLHFV